MSKKLNTNNISQDSLSNIKSISKDTLNLSSCNSCSCEYKENTIQNNTKRLENDDNNINYTKRIFFTTCIKFLTLIGFYYFFSTLLKTMFPNSDILEHEYLEIELDEIKEGYSVTKYWQGKPIFIKHRTSQEIYDANNISLSNLKDPEEDLSRVKQFQEKWLIVIGICTHLGCIPIHNKGNISGGWLCPCHNSEYDSSGRVISGPAAKNLAIPPYKFINHNLIRIG